MHNVLTQMVNRCGTTKTRSSKRGASLSALRAAFNGFHNSFLPTKPERLSIGLITAKILAIPRRMRFYAQRLDADGKPLWEINGIPVCSAPKAQITPRAIPTGTNAAIVVWGDARGADEDIYIQRIPVEAK